jgi:hypothetical protein
VNYVIGDSHVTIFSGQDCLTVGFPNIHGDKLPNFTTGNVSAYLAYNFGQHEHPVTVTTDKYLRLIPKKSTVIFSFGEIDCRCHVWKEVRVQKKPVIAVVSDVVARYVNGLQKYVDDYDVYALLPHSIKRKEDIFEAVGTWDEITLASMLFNVYMREWNADRCISIFDWTYNCSIFNDPDYYLDDTHLSQRCLPEMLMEVQKKGIAV